MSAHTALRLVVRPVRRAAILDQLVKPRICLRCSIAINLRTSTRSGRARLFSTAPPPPRRPNPAESSSPPEPATSNDAPATTTSPPPPEEAEPQPGPSSSSSEAASPPPPPPSQETGSPSEPDDPALPSFTETHRHPLSARFSTFMDNLQSRALTATQTLNDLTGYSAIEAIKARNSQLERDLAAAQVRLRSARHSYKSLTAHRAATQREVTTLLARKDTWTPADLERFTTLYRLDHELEAQVAGAAAELTDAEAAEARLSAELNAGILKRYHEEQIWSDRIRRQSTWGTWGLMGVNVVLFLVLQFVAEPWRRKRLMRGIAEREEGFMDDVRRELEEVKAALAASGLRQAADAQAVGRPVVIGAAAGAESEGDAAVVAAGPEPVAPLEVDERAAGKPWKDVLAGGWRDPELVKTAVRDLYSDRRTDLRMRDVSMMVLESAAAGATVVAAVAFAWLRITRT